MQNILLLTSTIKPKNQAGLAVINFKERLQEYVNCLEYYCDLVKSGLVDKVVFVDNSGFDVDFLKDKYSNFDVEIISFYGLDYDANFHRGYGEFNLINYAYKKSLILNSLSSDACVWKISGRYKVVNIVNMIKTKPHNVELYFDMPRKEWVSMELIMWKNRAYYTCVQQFESWFETNLPPEMILAEKLAILKNNLNIIDEFHWMPVINGRRGTDGTRFENRNKVKFLLIKLLKLIKRPSLLTKLS